ncbi:MAG: DMT family transporter [Geobacteraceae bacterium]|nr:DMT family transporter [Geobacteraceae bacterium]NTW80147.1 DMT family transporter [Geobacteraceae bacterium]
MTTSTTPAMNRVYFFLVLTTFFWGGSFLFTKIGVATIPPQIFVLTRFILATLIMLLVCSGRLRKLDLGTLVRGMTVGIALGLTNMSFVYGIQGTSISRAGILNNLFVLFIPVITKVVWRDRIGRVNMAGIALAVAGIVLLATGGGTGFNRGDFFSTFCAFLIACHIISVSKVLKNDDVFLITLVQFATVTLIAGAATLLLPLPAFTFTQPAILSIIYCAVFPTVFCFTLQNIYQRYVTPTRAGLVYTLDPVWSLIAGFFVLGERLNSVEWIGCGIIFLAALLPLLFRLSVESKLITTYIKQNR